MTEKKTKRLSTGQQFVLWALSHAPMTKSEMAQYLKCSDSFVVWHIRELKKDGLVYVSDHKKTAGKPAPIYAVHVKHSKPAASSPRVGVDATSREMVESALREMGPMTAVELSEHLGIRRNRVNATLTHHRNNGKSSKVFRVAKWVWLDRHGYIAAYGLGPHADAPKPKPNKKENQARYREKMKSIHRSKTKTFAGNPFGELIHMAGVTYQAAYWNSREAA